MLCFNTDELTLSDNLGDTNLTNVIKACHVYTLACSVDGKVVLGIGNKTP